MTVLVRPARAPDLSEVTRLHRRAFPCQLTTRLGRSVVRDYYARSLDPTSTMRLVVAESDGRLAGFASTLQPAPFYAQYRRGRLKVLVRALPALAASPGLARQVVGATSRARTSASDPVDGIELSSIAVDAEVRGTGVGTALMAAVRDQVRTAAARLYLWTDAEDNEQTLAFYRRLGFRPEEERSFDGSRLMVRLGLELGGQRPQIATT